VIGSVLLSVGSDWLHYTITTTGNDPDRVINPATLNNNHILHNHTLFSSNEHISAYELVLHTGSIAT